MMFRSVEDLQAEAYDLSSMAESYLRRGRHPSTISCLERSLRLRRKIEDGGGEVGVLHDLAEVYEGLGNADLARRARDEAAALREAVSGEAREVTPVSRRMR